MENPFFEDWRAPFGAPPLDRVGPEHFVPAYARALAEHDAEIAVLAAAPAGFEATIMGLEKSGRLLARVEAVFSTLVSANSNDALQAIELEMAPKLSAHWSAIYLNAELFGRIDALYKARATLGLDAESLRVLERYHLDFVRQGAMLKGDGRARLNDIGQRLATLSAEFSQNVLADGGRAGIPARGGGVHRQRARSGCALRRHPVAFQCRTLPPIRRRPRLARTIIQILCVARRQ